MELCGWGRHPVIDAEVSYPSSRSSAVAAVVSSAPHPMIARGMGRSYGDSALAARVVSSRYLNLLLDFDPAGGKVRCGAGVTLAELLEVANGAFAKNAIENAAGRVVGRTDDEAKRKRATQKVHHRALTFCQALMARHVVEQEQEVID